MNTYNVCSIQIILNELRSLGRTYDNYDHTDKIDLNMHHIFPVSNSTWTDREYFSFSSFCFYYYSLNKISLHMGHNLLLQNLCSCNRCQSISVNLLCVLLTIFHSIDYFVDYERENFHQYLDHLNRFFFSSSE